MCHVSAPGPNSEVGFKYNCSSQLSAPYYTTNELSPNALFGPSVPIGGNLNGVAVATNSTQLEVRICLDQPFHDEDIYVGYSKFTVTHMSCPANSNFGALDCICNAGFVLSELSTRVVNDLSCVRTVQVPTKIFYKHTAVATYKCNTGYELNGSSTSTCSAAANWTSAAPTCTLLAGPCSPMTSFRTVGNFTWTCPSTVTQIELYIIGGGGAGSIDHGM